MTTKKGQYRQGDVFLMRVETLPEGAEKEAAAGEGTNVVLAWGEVTGHSHAIPGEYAIAYQFKGERLIEAKPGAVLRHEEHAPIELDPGFYKVVIQREYTPKEIRRVID